MQTSDPACQTERIIPPSRRPDGTMRKPIRIRAGFRPDGDYTPFKPRVIQERDAAAASALEQERLLKEQQRMALLQQEHKARRKRNKKKAPQQVDSVDAGVEELTNKMEEIAIEVDVIALGKRLRNLRKRLAKANELESRYEAGEELSMEEINKINRREEMQQEITRIQQAILYCSAQ